MFAVECLQAAAAPLHIFTGNFAGTSLLLVKELSLELYQWSADAPSGYFELHKLHEELTFFPVLSAAVVSLGDRDGVAVVLTQVSARDKVRVYGYSPRGFESVAEVTLPVELCLGLSLKALWRGSATILGTAALEDWLWLGTFPSLQIRQSVLLKQSLTDMGGLILDWDFSDSAAIVLRHSAGATYPEVAAVSLTGEVQYVISLIHMVADVRDIPVNLVSATPTSFYVFLSNGSMLSVDSISGKLIDLQSIDKLYTASCPCPTGLFVVSDDGAVIHISREGKVKVILTCEPDSLIACSDRLLLTWSAMGNGKAFLLADDMQLICDFPTPGHGPIFDGFATSQEAIITACGTGQLSTLRKSEKGNSQPGLDVIETVRMPDIGATASGVWSVNGHLFLSYTTVTKCISLKTYAEVAVDQWNFDQSPSIAVGEYGDRFMQVTRQQIRYWGAEVSYSEAVTTACIRDRKVYAGLANAQLSRCDPLNLSETVLTVEAEITALHVNDSRVFAGLANNKIVVYPESVTGPALLTVDLSKTLGDSVPNDLL